MPAPQLVVSAPLNAHAFTVREAQSAGVTLGLLRSDRFTAPHWGVRAVKREHAEPAALHDRVFNGALQYLPLLRQQRGERFSHTTALLLWRAPIRVSDALHVTIPLPHGAARGKNVQGHTTTGTLGDEAVSSSGVQLPVVTPAQALLFSASTLSFRELVVAADHLVAPRGQPGHRHALTTIETLREEAACASVPGVQRLRAALSVARVGAESRMESFMHIELARMGLDDLELQADITDAAGRWIGRFDAVDRAKRKILEYDGDQHRTDRTQYLRDLERLERVRNAGYAVLRLQQEDFRPDRLSRTRTKMCTFLEAEPRPISKQLARYFAHGSR